MHQQPTGTDKQALEALNEHFGDKSIMYYRSRDGYLSTLDLRNDKTTDETIKLLPGFSHLKKLTFQGTAITDDGLRLLSEIPTLEELDLRSTAVTNAGLKFLTELPELKKLELYNTKVTDAGMKYLGGIETLQELDLDCLPISHQGTKHLAHLTNLRSLSLDETKVDDRTMPHLTGLIHLKWLLLRGTQITDAGMKNLAPLTRLQYLYLSNTAITDKSLIHLSKMQDLQYLELKGTQCSVDGFRHLCHLPKFKKLNARNTAITDNVAEHLCRFPNLREFSATGTLFSEWGRKQIKQNLKRCLVEVDTLTPDTAVPKIEWSKDYFWKNPPTCLRRFTLHPHGKKRPVDETKFDLKCQCGCQQGRILGYPLANYNSDYSGSLFVSPLAFVCIKCRKRTSIIDTDTDGYHGMMGASATIRGEGRRTVWACDKCTGTTITVNAHFNYPGGEWDLLESDPHTKVQDYFNLFTLNVVCQDCQHEAVVAEFTL